ncbi:MAG: TonB-dependent receptor [Bacteroidales bacterium]|nr:TonB-dependent receptor [Bacteroidales bacterium]
MNVALRLVLSLTALLGTVSLFAQDSLAVKGMLNDTLVLQNATVTAKSREQKLREGAFAVGALNIRLQASTLQSLTQAIDRSSGIRIREEGGVGSEFDLSINGMSGNSIRYFLDGMPLDAKGTGMTLANLPVNIIERVEIYKGVIPVSFGSDALGGAVNIVTNRSRRNYLDFSYGIGSFHTHKADFSAQYTGKKTGLIFKPVISANYSKNDYLMRGVKVRNEDRTAFVIKDLPRFHDDYLSLFGQMEVGVADRSWADAFFVSASVSKVDKDIQTGATQDRVIGMAERHTQSLNVSARYEKVDFLTDGMQFQVSASHTMDHSQTIDTTYRRYYWDGSYIDGSYSEIRSRGKTLRHYRRPLTVVSSNLSYRLAEGHELALNYVFNRAGNRQTDDWDTDFVPTDDVLAKHIAGLSYDQSLLSGRLNNAFFVKDYVNHLMIGQNELPSTTGANVVQGSDTKNYVGYGLGTRYLFFDPLAVKGSYEHSVRLPISRELLGNGSTVYPNVALKPEISENFNIGLFGTVDLGGGHSISYEMNGFVRLVDNYIRATVTETESMMQYVNVAAVHIKGVDGEIRYDWAGKLHVAANASYDDSRDMRKYTQSGDLSVTYRNRTPNRPWTYANTEVSYSFYDVGLRGSRLRLSADYQWVHWFYLTWAAFGSASSKSKVPTQHITNASLLYSWHANRYNVSLECTNLLDALAFDNYMLQKPGRAFFLKFRLFL